MNFVRVMNVKKEKAIIMDESAIESKLHALERQEKDIFHCCYFSFPEINSFFLRTSSEKIDGEELLGSLWYRRHSGDLCCLDGSDRVGPLKDSAGDFAVVESRLAPFLLTTESWEGRCIAVLSEQLEGVDLKQGERVLVRRSGAITGDSQEDLVEKEIKEIDSSFFSFDFEVSCILHKAQFF